jgi:hypothetical protein
MDDRFRAILEKYFRFKGSTRTLPPVAKPLPAVEDEADYREDEIAFVVGLENHGDSF